MADQLPRYAVAEQQRCGLTGNPEQFPGQGSEVHSVFWQVEAEAEGHTRMDGSVTGRSYCLCSAWVGSECSVELLAYGAGEFRDDHSIGSGEIQCGQARQVGSAQGACWGLLVL
jgi:hypothetical protein